MKKVIELNVNGDTRDVVIEDHSTLLEVLREGLGLTGIKRGCDHGACGACTVLVDGKAVLSCCQLAIEMEGRRIETIEGLSSGGQLHPLQGAFVEKGAVQCGFCTPGMILTAKALLDENSKASEEGIKRAIGGNYCRCTGYNQIVRAVKAVAEEAGPLSFSLRGLWRTAASVVNKGFNPLCFP
ncbi:MAG: (2Fe-2S)-binding protein [Deltaproteobacteria bacterium]|nr:(2Fe-2S)-binding protein [Deltaproteobacteria bacterium]MBW2138813.1 (2Fe-2S)-binding protein [Deltaproteobacteria bacterium]